VAFFAIIKTCQKPHAFSLLIKLVLISFFLSKQILAESFYDDDLEQVSFLSVSGSHYKASFKDFNEHIQKRNIDWAASGFHQDELDNDIDERGIALGIGRGRSAYILGLSVLDKVSAPAVTPGWSGASEISARYLSFKYRYYFGKPRWSRERYRNSKTKLFPFFESGLIWLSVKWTEDNFVYTCMTTGISHTGPSYAGDCFALHIGGGLDYLLSENFFTTLTVGHNNAKIGKFQTKESFPCGCPSGTHVPYFDYDNDVKASLDMSGVVIALSFNMRLTTSKINKGLNF